MSDEFWESAALRDPLWAILSDPSKKGRRWTTREFFATGQREVSTLMYQLHQLGRMPARGRALDFGCGVGRLTQALARFFPEVVGADISPTMLRLAEHANMAPDRVRYVRNQPDHLAEFASETFDFVYSDIVLQHLPSHRARRFITDFLRVLKPGGVTVFQIPSERRSVEDRPFCAVSMDPRAYRAQIDVNTRLPPTLAPGEQTTLLVECQNLSDDAWDQRVVGPIRLGNHWLSEAGDMLVQDDGRTLVDSVLPPSTPVRLSLQITAPLDVGRYVCELDLVHEGLTWFGHKGSRTARLPVEVTGDDVSGSHSLVDPDADIPLPEWDPELPALESFEVGEFPMDGIHRDEVLALISTAGGHIFHLEPDERGGPEWNGYRYYVQR
jgi:SAM-dependent methyltransferase